MSTDSMLCMMPVQMTWITEVHRYQTLFIVSLLDAMSTEVRTTSTTEVHSFREPQRCKRFIPMHHIAAVPWV